MRFGPETLSLYYFAPISNTRNTVFFLPEIYTKTDYDDYIQRIHTKLVHYNGIECVFAYYFPNTEIGPVLSLFGHHAFLDGGGCITILKQLSDN